MGIAEFAGRIGRVVSHEIEKTVKLIAETRKNYNQKAVQYNPSGEDSPPVKEDQLVMLKIDGTGKYVAVGVFNESQGAKPGEKILFARDQKGNIVLKIKMLNNGDYIFDNHTETTGEAAGNYKRNIKGNDDLDAGGNAKWSIDGNLNIAIGGAITIKAGGVIKINGQMIHLNEPVE